MNTFFDKVKSDLGQNESEKLKQFYENMSKQIKQIYNEQ